MMCSERWSCSRKDGGGTVGARVVPSGTRRGNAELLVCGVKGLAFLGSFLGALPTPGQVEDTRVVSLW